KYSLNTIVGSATANTAPCPPRASSGPTPSCVRSTAVIGAHLRPDRDQGAVVVEGVLDEIDDLRELQERRFGAAQRGGQCPAQRTAATAEGVPHAVRAEQQMLVGLDRELDRVDLVGREERQRNHRGGLEHLGFLVPPTRA